MITLFALLLLANPAHAGKKKTEAPPPPPAAEAAAPATDPAFEADIRRMLVITGAGAIAEQVMDQMLTSLRPMAPQLPDAFWEEARKEFGADQFMELSVPIYARHLTHDDVKQLITFYESPVGQKLVKVQPAISREAMEAGQAWGQQMGMRLIQRIEAEKAK